MQKWRVASWCCWSKSLKVTSSLVFTIISSVWVTKALSQMWEKLRSKQQQQLTEWPLRSRGKTHTELSVCLSVRLSERCEVGGVFQMCNRICQHIQITHTYVYLYILYVLQGLFLTHMYQDSDDWPEPEIQSSTKHITTRLRAQLSHDTHHYSAAFHSLLSRVFLLSLKVTMWCRIHLSNRECTQFRMYYLT